MASTEQNKKTVTTLVADPAKHLKQSVGKYEWLGHGIYFWENDPQRAYEWANTGNAKSKIKSPDAVTQFANFRIPASARLRRNQLSGQVVIAIVWAPLNSDSGKK